MLHSDNCYREKLSSEQGQGMSEMWWQGEGLQLKLVAKVPWRWRCIQIWRQQGRSHLNPCCSEAMQSGKGWGGIHLLCDPSSTIHGRASYSTSLWNPQSGSNIRIHNSTWRFQRLNFFCYPLWFLWFIRETSLPTYLLNPQSPSPSSQPSYCIIRYKMKGHWYWPTAVTYKLLKKKKKKMS